jgi:hypothetical protein
MVLQQPDVFMEKVSLARRLFRDRAEKYIDRLTRNVISLLKKRVDPDAGAEVIAAEARAAFDSVQFRTKFIEDVEIRKAYSFGIAMAAKDTGYDTYLSTAHKEDPCNKCKSLSGNQFPLEFVTIDDVAPHHAGCECHFGVMGPAQEDGDEYIQDSSVAVPPPHPSVPLSSGEQSADDPNGVLPETEVQDCPTCGTSSIRSDGAPNTFFCNKCRKAFEINSKDEKLDDVTKLERCVQSVKKDLRKRHPDWSAEKIKSSAFAICNSRIKESNSEQG